MATSTCSEFEKIWKKFFFRICQYAAASTAESVYIISGYTAGSPHNTPTIAEYKNENWKNAGNLAQARRSHGAITFGLTTMIVGGDPTTGLLWVQINLI